jgi:hypothetical protein
MQFELVDTPIVAVKGKVPLLTAPGVGVVPKESVILKYQV